MGNGEMGCTEKCPDLFLPLFLPFKLVLAFAWPYFSPKSHETGPKVLVLAQAMPRGKKAKLNHMVLVGGQILVTRVQNKVTSFVVSLNGF